MTIEQIKNAVMSIKDDFPIARVILFGSRANGTNKSDSDVDLVMEFTEGISLLTLVSIKTTLEDILGVNVDVIHGPITEDDMIEVGEEIELYAA